MRANIAKLNMVIGFSGCILLAGVANSVNADPGPSRRGSDRRSLPDASSRLPSYDDVRDRIEQAIPGVLRAHGDGTIRDAYEAFARRSIDAERMLKPTPGAQGVTPSCRVEDALGNPVFAVPAAIQQIEPNYWLRYFDAGRGLMK